MLIHATYVLAQAAGLLSRRVHAGSGSVLPGRVALALDPQALRRLSRGRDVVLVSGTNGKTTTTCLIAAALGSRGEVQSNHEGSNLEAGLVTALLSQRSAGVAVLEVDEIVLMRAAAATNPTTVVLLNLSRDQLDRTWEVSAHVGRWAQALAGTTAIVVANADDPLVVAAVARARPDLHDVTWVAAGQPWRGDVPVCPCCGGTWDNSLTLWACARCGLRRPTPEWTVKAGALMRPAQPPLPLDLHLPGSINEGNAAMAVAAADAMGVPPDVSVPRMAEIDEVAGRYLQVTSNGREFGLVLAKNPAGWGAALEEAHRSRGALLLAINSRAADGVDPSWLWDVPLEELAGRDVVVTGERALDLSNRLRYAQVGHTVHRELAAALNAVPPGHVHVLANYTAFVQLRGQLASRRS